MRTKVRRVGGVVSLVLLAVAAPLRAQDFELTAAMAADSASAPRPTLLVAFGRAPRPVGFEVEYAGSAGKDRHGQKSVGSIVGSLLVNTPWRIGQARIYVTSGLGVYGETGGGSNSGEASAVHAGAGVSIPVCNALKWRVEYRLLTLLDYDGPVASTHPQRVTTGFSLGF